MSCRVDFIGPCTQVQGRGSCPQVHHRRDPGRTRRVLKSSAHHVQHLPSPPHHTFNSKNSTSHRTILHECGTVSWFVLNSLSARSKQNKHRQRAHSTCARACLAEHSRIRWVRRDSSRRSAELGHARDWTVTEQPTPVRDGSMKLATQFRAARTP